MLFLNHALAMQSLVFLPMPEVHLAELGVYRYWPPGHICGWDVEFKQVFGGRDLRRDKTFKMPIASTPKYYSSNWFCCGAGQMQQ